MKHFLTLITLLTLCSCINRSYSEKNTLNKIGKFYGGDVTTSSGFKTENTANTNYFAVKVFNSPLIENDVKNTTFSAGNIAFLAYSNLENEKSKYDEFYVTIGFANNETRSFTFTKNQLEQNRKIVKIIDDFNSFIIRKEYQALLSISNKDFIENEKVFSDIFDKLYSEFGTIKQIQYQGFVFENDEKIGECLSTKQVIEFDNKNVNIYIFISLKDNKIVGFSFH